MCGGRRGEHSTNHISLKMMYIYCVCVCVSTCTYVISVSINNYYTCTYMYTCVCKQHKYDINNVHTLFLQADAASVGRP